VLPVAKLARLAAAACAAGAVQAAPLAVRVVDTRGQPLPGAVVFVESAAARAALKAAPTVEIAQEKRQFLPQVSVVPLGSAVSFPNRDTVRHHVYSFNPTKFELKLYIGRPANPVVFDRPGIAVLGCNIHDEMVGWVVVVETPWFAGTGADGVARLDVPPGAHRLRVWHTGLAVGASASEQAVDIGAAGAQAAVTLALQAGAR
jgi:plastocyanin